MNTEHETYGYGLTPTGREADWREINTGPSPQGEHLLLADLFELALAVIVSKDQVSLPPHVEGCPECKGRLDSFTRAAEGASATLERAPLGSSVHQFSDELQRLLKTLPAESGEAPKVAVAVKESPEEPRAHVLSLAKERSQQPWWMFLSGAGGAAAAAMIMLSVYLVWPPGARNDFGERGGNKGGIRLGSGEVWTVSSSLWPGNRTHRDEKLQRLLQFSSSFPVHVWTARANGPQGVHLLEGGEWKSLDAGDISAIGLEAPAPRVDAEWFVSAFVINPPAGFNHDPSPEQLKRVSDTLLRLLQEQVESRALLRATTRDQQLELEKGLRERVCEEVPSMKRNLQIKVRHWQVLNE